MRSNFFNSLFLTLALVACVHQPDKAANSSPPKPEWIVQSDRMAEEFTRALAANRPEVGSQLGYPEYDRLGVLFNEETEDKDRSILVTWDEKLNQEIAKTQDLELKTDYQVLQGWIRNHITEIDAYRAAHEVEFSAGTKEIYQNLQILLNPQSSAQRKRAAVERFKVYVHGDANHHPLLQAWQEHFQAQLKKYGSQKPLLPYRAEVEEYLKDSPSFLTGIEEMLKTSGRADWTDDWTIFQKQAHDYAEFVDKVVLKHVRQDFRIPASIYAQILKRRGIDSTPEQLIATGLRDYKTVYKDFRTQARAVAAKHKLDQSDPASVIHFLKSKPVTSSKEVEELYRAADQRLEQIIKDNGLISVPQAPLKIRVAGEAESKALPIPHLAPPPIVNNHGERPEFIVPSSPQGLPFDDFSSKDSAMVLTAHEGRPGHDMQYSQMLDHGLSVIRSRYAMNNVNIEGWGLYAEDLVYPYLEPEEKLFALQTRLWRIARMFLDPQIQLGRIKDERVIDLFTKELGVSKVMAGLELRRYKFDDIGQAPSYYQGYLVVNMMRSDSQARLGSNFNLKCFNDRLLSFGVLPLAISADRISQETACTTQ
jgi:hypothetical protein